MQYTSVSHCLVSKCYEFQLRRAERSLERQEAEKLLKKCATALHKRPALSATWQPFFGEMEIMLSLAEDRIAGRYVTISNSCFLQILALLCTIRPVLYLPSSCARPLQRYLQAVEPLFPERKTVLRTYEIWKGRE